MGLCLRDMSVAFREPSLVLMLHLLEILVGANFHVFERYLCVFVSQISSLFPSFGDYTQIEGGASLNVCRRNTFVDGDTLSGNVQSGC